MAGQWYAAALVGGCPLDDQGCASAATTPTARLQCQQPESKSCAVGEGLPAWLSAGSAHLPGLACLVATAQMWEKCDWPSETNWWPPATLIIFVEENVPPLPSSPLMLSPAALWCGHVGGRLSMRCMHLGSACIASQLLHYKPRSLLALPKST